MLTHEKFALLILTFTHESVVAQAAHLFSITITANRRENAGRFTDTA